MSPIRIPVTAVVTESNYGAAIAISRIGRVTIDGCRIAVAICRVRRVSPVSITAAVTVTGTNPHTETHARLGRSRSYEDHESQCRNYRKSNLFKHCFPPHCIGRGLFFRRYGEAH